MDKDLLLQHILEGMSIDDKLYEAASKGELDKVQHYLEIGASVFSTSKLEDDLQIEDLVYNNSAPLMKAAQNGHLPVVIALLNHQKNHGQRKTYWTILVETIKNQAVRSDENNTQQSGFLNDSSLVDLINMNEFNMITHNFHIMTHLIKYGVDVNNVLRNGLTPLMLAAKTGSIAAMKHMLANGADVDIEIVSSTDKILNSSIMFAVTEFQKEALTILIEHGVNMNSMSAVYAFFISVSRGQRDVIQLMVLHGARPCLVQSYDLCKMNLINFSDIYLFSEKVSPLYMALYSNQSEVACHFLSIGFVTEFDIKLLRHKNDLRSRLEADDEFHNALEILNDVTSQPMPLVILTFVNVLNSLPKGCKQMLIKNVDSLNIPSGMKMRLLFNINGNHS